ncbi:hypothetical protein [Enterococcus sp. AZ072]|uniref:hypothetical protein n=1 Tax=unclassified Enterococcus TaxID=2608891 RepID=UPI003D2C58CB
MLLLLLLLGGYFAYNYFSENDSATVIAGNFLPEGKDASKMTEAEVADYAQQAVDNSQFNMRIVASAIIDQESMTGKLAIQNPPSNAQPANVIVTLDSTGEVLYTSGAIQPGEEIKEATLDKKLNQGTYSATATFEIFNSDTKKQQGQVKSALEIVVQ